MTGPPNKRQKREDFRKAQEVAKDGGSRMLALPKKKFYRQRAHANPFSDHALSYPTSPADKDWSTHFPAFKQDDSAESNSSAKPKKQVEIADIGCGFGGLLVALSPIMPDTLMIGMELRTQVTLYVINRIAALRSQHQTPTPAQPDTIPPYANISALRTNTMKFLPNYFTKCQLSKIFLCFPDPHFKQRKHKARIVSAQLNAEYAYFLRPGGRLYTITDVQELHGWIVGHFDEEEAGDGRELWRRIPEEELGQDKCVEIMSEETEEGKKVGRNGGRKYVAVWEKRADPVWPT